MDYHKQFIDESTGLFQRQHTELRSCPVCKKNNYTPMFVKEGGNYVICCNCRMVYLNPVFTDSSLEHFYANNHSAQSETSDADISFYNRIYSKGLSLVEGITTNHNRILDFGCSSGNFLTLAHQKGWNESVGIELNAKEAEIARSKGHHVFSSIEALIEDGGLFDLITLWDVFEHLKDGEKALRDFKNLLTKDGVILLQVPNAGSLAAKIMHEKCNMFDGLEHVNLYSPDTIETLAKNCGFDVLAIKTVISEINVLQNYLNYEDGYTGSQPSVSSLFPEIDEKYILDNNLGYKMQVAIRR